MVQQKILLIRMIGLGDVTCIGIPALRHVKTQFPQADIHMLTFAAGKELIELAEPSVTVIALEQNQWPENILPAMQVFSELAEILAEQEFDLVINIDTGFMPCFLTRSLKDAGQKVSGNYIDMPVSTLLAQFSDETLDPEFVNNPENYLASSWLSMAQWHSPWWDKAQPPAGGYPEFYLRHCCGFNCELDMHIDVRANGVLNASKKPVVAIACNAHNTEHGYPYGDELRDQLEAQGVNVWTGFDGSIAMKDTLSKLKSSDLLVTVPSAPQWLATAVGTPSLVISGDVDPRTLMPDYATDMSEAPILPEILVDGVMSILQELREHA